MRAHHTVFTCLLSVIYFTVACRFLEETWIEVVVPKDTSVICFERLPAAGVNRKPTFCRDYLGDTSVGARNAGAKVVARRFRHARN